MITSNQIVPGMILKVEGKIYRVDSSVKVVPPKGTPFIKTKLKPLVGEKTLEKTFKLQQSIEEVALVEHILEYLYREGKSYLFLDIKNLEQVLVSPEILGEKIHYLKEGIQLKALFYGDTIFSVELPQFLELMVIKTEATNEKMKITGTTKKAVLETGAKIEVPLFIEVGDVLKVDVYTNEYVQRM